MLEHCGLSDIEEAAYLSLLAAASGTPAVDVVAGTAAQAEQWTAVRELARYEILSIDKPSSPAAVDPTPARGDGVRMRSIYDRRALTVPGVLHTVLARAGGRYRQTRLIAQAPFQLRVADERLAVVRLNGARVPVGKMLVIRPSPLLEGVVNLFETLWRHAVPLESGRGPDDPSTDEARLLAVMAAGMTDEAAARHLGLSLRTVQRQVRAMMDRLGAQTRFQAGLQAKDRGWL